MKKNKCVICGYPAQEVLIINGVVVKLCGLHLAEYRYKPDNFLERHGLKEGY